jgi:hypothetical protein
MEWIHWAVNRDKLQAIVNTVMNLQFPKNAEIILLLFKP